MNQFLPYSIPSPYPHLFPLCLGLVSLVVFYSQFLSLFYFHLLPLISRPDAGVWNSPYIYAADIINTDSKP